jgi:hypothetical protein
MTRRAALCAALGVAALPWPWVVWAQADAAVAEYQVKAAYLYKFLDFVEWPAASFESAKSPFVLGVIGADALAAELEVLISRRRAEHRPALIRRLKPGEAVDGLHVLFVGRSAGARAPTLLASAAQQPVLTVTEFDEGLSAGGVINFVVVDKRVRFDVALRSAEAREIKISSRLLGVARRVENTS